VGLTDHMTAPLDRFGSFMKALTETMTTDRDADRRNLEAGAQKAYGETERRHWWTTWARLSFTRHVSEETATKYIERWAAVLRRKMPGTAVLLGIHNDTPLTHCHALIYVPRRHCSISSPAPGIHVVSPSPWTLWAGAILNWPHGPVWVTPYDPAFSDGERAHGAAEYLARFPGTVLHFGTAPPRHSVKPK